MAMATLFRLTLSAMTLLCAAAAISRPGIVAVGLGDRAAGAMAGPVELAVTGCALTLALWLIWSHE